VSAAGGELAAIAEQYPAWHPWRSQGGRWWATRWQQTAHGRGRDPRWSMTVDADDAEGLRAELREQDGIDAAGALW
jgi:hypothetical protein